MSDSRMDPRFSRCKRDEGDAAVRILITHAGIRIIEASIIIIDAGKGEEKKGKVKGRISANGEVSLFSQFEKREDEHTAGMTDIWIV